MYLNVLATDTIYRTILKENVTHRKGTVALSSYKVVK